MVRQPNHLFPSIFIHPVLPYAKLMITKDFRNSPAVTRYNVLSTIDKYNTSLMMCAYLCPLESEGFITKWAQRHRHCTSFSVFNRWWLTPENHPLQADYLFCWAPTAFFSSSVWRACRANKRKLNDIQMKKIYITFVFQLRKANSQTMLRFLWLWGACNHPKWAKSKLNLSQQQWFSFWVWVFQSWSQLVDNVGEDLQVTPPVPIAG